MIELIKFISERTIAQKRLRLEPIQAGLECYPGGSPCAGLQIRGSHLRVPQAVPCRAFREKFRDIFRTENHDENSSPVFDSTNRCDHYQHCDSTQFRRQATHTSKFQEYGCASE